MGYLKLPVGDQDRQEIIMFARKVTMQLKPNGVAEFTRRMEKEVLPLLRKQNGFQDEMTFIATDDREAFGISLWDRKESAETYHRGSYPEVAKILATVIEGTPQVGTYEVASSTLHTLAAAA